MFVAESDRKFQNDAVEYLLDKTSFELPEEFLKKWMQTVSETPVTKEEIESQFVGYKTSLKWQIIEKGVFTYVKITVKPYTSSKISKLLYPIFHYAVIRPKLKSYLKSVLKGLEYYLSHKKPVPQNKFGNHSWFSKPKSFNPVEAV